MNIVITHGINYQQIAKIDFEYDGIQFTSEVMVGCETEEEAMKCVQETHLPNMRRNDRRLTGIVFDWEIPAVVEEPVIDEPVAPPEEPVIPDEPPVEGGGV